MSYIELSNEDKVRCRQFYWKGKVHDCAQWDGAPESFENLMVLFENGIPSEQRSYWSIEDTRMVLDRSEWILDKGEPCSPFYVPLNSWFVWWPYYGWHSYEDKEFNEFNMGFVK